MIYAYDDFSRLVRKTDGLARVWVSSYDVNNNLSTALDLKNQTTQFSWARGHQLLTRIEQGGRTTTFTRNALGQVTKAQHPEVTYQYTYDVAHRPTSVTDGRGNTSLTYAWSPGGWHNYLIDQNGRTTYYLYDPVGRLAGIAAPNGDTIEFRFDPGGRLIEKTFANGIRTTYGWLQ